MAAGEKPAVLLIQNILPPYRLALFQNLSVSNIFSTTLGYGYASTNSALESILSPEGVHTKYLPTIYVGGKENIIFQRGALALIRSAQYDIVIAEFNPRIVSNILAFAYAKWSRTRFIWWGHGIGQYTNSIIMRLRLYLARFADAVIFYDSYQANRFISLGLMKEKVFVAPNTIDTREIEGLTKNWTEIKRTRILCIGRLVPKKKVDLLVRGFAMAYTQLDPDTKLTIVGDGPELPKIKSLVAQLGLTDQVEMVGSVYGQPALAPLFNSAWVSVSPGYVGLNAIHSLAYGVPVMAARDEPHSPEIAALEDGDNALFFSSDDAAELARTLVCLAQNPQQLAAMAQAAQRTVKDRLNLSAMVEAFEQAVQYVQRN